MRARGDKKGNGKLAIFIRKEEVVDGAHHGGSWKVAYADFVTAMMAFFLLMWLLNATSEEQRRGLADYFSPNAVLSHSSSGTGQPFGGRTAFETGAMVSNLGSAQVVMGDRPVVNQVEEDESDVIAQPRPYRDDVKSNEPDRTNGQRSQSPGSKTAAVARDGAPPRKATPVAVRSDAARAPTQAELQAELERREKQAFEQAAQQIREAVRGDPELADLARQLAIDVTPDGWPRRSSSAVRPPPGRCCPAAGRSSAPAAAAPGPPAPSRLP